MEILTTVLLGVLSLVIYVLKRDLDNRIDGLATKRDLAANILITESTKAKLELKHAACIDALSVVDSHFVYAYRNENPPPEPQPNPADVAFARACHNSLILACDDLAIVKRFEDIIFGEKPRPAVPTSPTKLLNDLRNLIRKELGFGGALAFDQDRSG